jgi:hypothetical protein
MKGLTHFATGVAAASCFPAAVQAAAQGNPLYFILGGACGLLPDTLDFKFYRFLVRHEMEVMPDPNRPDPQMIANAVAYAAHRAHLSGKPVRIKLNTVPVGLDAWQQYRIRFDVAGQRVLAAYGPVVNTGQTPLPGSRPPVRKEAEAPLAVPITLDYEAENAVDIFDGPLFRMVPTRDGRVRPEFIPWHREWSHGLALASLLAALGAWCWGWLAAAVIGVAFLAHVAGDQLGFMGSALLFPFTRRRWAGLGLMHSGETLPNFATVWLSCALIFWNLARAVPEHPLSLNLLQWILLAGLLPLAVFRLLDRWVGGKSPTA